MGGFNPDTALFGGLFSADIAGTKVNLTSFQGGGVEFQKTEATTGTRPDNLREYTITKVNWSSITLERNYVQGKIEWKDWYQKTLDGQIEYKAITLNYHDSENKPVRSNNFFECWPKRYDVINVDSKSGSSTVKEVMECEVDHAKYG
jgi:phage tail-like protein